MSSDEIFGEDLQPFSVGEDEQWGYGEETPDVLFRRHSQKISKELAAKDLEVKKVHDERVEKYKLLLSERQEIRRKNIFLQKKMVEFFKKRKMDHVLKEDPKGLDLESKYLKRLYELQEYKRTVEVSREDMMKMSSTLREETTQVQQNLIHIQKSFIEKQKMVASKLELKSKKKISTKAINIFLEKQSMNMENINKLRYLEIKEKRLLERKQVITQDLDSLGKGLQRADYEFLNFEHEIRKKLFLEKDKEMKKIERKVLKEKKILDLNRKKSHQVGRLLEARKIQRNETEAQMIETHLRLRNLKKMVSNLRKERQRMEENCGLLTQPAILRDFASSLQEIEQLQKQLNDLKVDFQQTTFSGRGNPANTPDDLFCTQEVVS